ncbi:MAG TPA: HAMP domain-containing sensor histidine kinase [Acidobacteriota bacterium]
MPKPLPREPFTFPRVLVLILGLLVLPSLTLGIFGILLLMAQDVRVLPYVMLLLLSAGSIAVGTTLVARAAWRGARLNRLKTDFVSQVSHELRTPLTSIRMFIETLKLGRARTDQERQDCLDLLAKETKRLSEMIERVLEWARLEAGRKVLRAEPLSPQALIEEVLEVFQAQQLGGAERLIRDLAPDLPQVWADRGAVIDVLLNLLSNAFKYSGDHKEIRVVARAAGRWVTIAVEDNGPGIRKLDRKRIFERFYRGDDLLSRRTEGSGLGLSIAKRLAEGLGGRLLYSARESGGSRFTLRLRALRSKQARKAHAAVGHPTPVTSR